MKRMSLKWKVTLWYACMLLLMIFLLFGFLISTSDQLLRSESAEALEEAVWDFVDEVKVNRKEETWSLDDDIRFYEKGVVFSLYDGQGRLIAGSVPTGFPEDTTLKAYALQKISDSSEKWTVYDAAIPYGDGKILWARGAYGEDALTTVEGVMLHLLLVACPLLMVFALLVGYSITRRALLPIEEIRETAEKIGESGDLSRRIQVEHAQGEVRQMADTFNHMFSRLENSFEKERQFTSDASHELRTPAAVILAEAEYALLPDTEPEEQKEGLQVIHQQAQRMSELLSQLLLLARADHGKETLIKEPVAISDLAFEALKEQKKHAEDHQITLEHDIQPGLFVEGDRNSLMRIFRNLLENAIQYGRENGWVRLSVCKKDGEIFCKVQDNGIGIEAEHLEKIWNRFYRVDTVRNSGSGNSGLGLSIVKWIVEEHGGTIYVESRPKEGSCFVIRFPQGII